MVVDERGGSLSRRR
uniref:Uncharacterized protein n=1 Tax=Zea mays TaxID=4577 RepID=C4J1P5_MAIZE|nr:unknown [Zea mays]